MTKNLLQQPIIDQILEVKKVSEIFYRNLRNSKRNEQRRFATALCKLASIPTDRALGLDELTAFEDLLDLNIRVVSARLGNKFI